MWIFSTLKLVVCFLETVRLRDKTEGAPPGAILHE
jgi:hypothetical protein